MSTTATPRLTKEQERAITTRDVSIALSAGAGCGKTFVLTERFLAHFDPHSPHALRPDQLGQLIAITFTERAAREMRDRIRRKCYDRLLAAQGDALAIEYWAKLLRFLDEARVSTIHSFCGSLLRANAVDAGVDPQFAVLEQSEADTVLSEIVEDTIRRLLSDREETVLNLLVAFPLEGLREMIVQLAGCRERAQFAEWTSREPKALVALWSDFFHQQVLPTLCGRIATCAAANELLYLLADEISTNSTLRAHRTILLSTLQSWRKLPPEVSNPAAEIAALRESTILTGIGTKKEWLNDDVQQRFKTAAKALRDEIDKVGEALHFDESAALPAAATALDVLRIAAQVVEAYDKFKRDHSRLDFDDLLIHAHALLTNRSHAELQRRLSGQLRLLLVDEFQDTDPLQVEIVAALCGEGVAKGKLFFVGDQKQSIYRFRGAEPQVFRDLRSRTPTSGQLPLTLNFRSQPAILDFVNALFHAELIGEYEPLVPHREQLSPTPAIEFLWAPAEHKPGVKESKDELRIREADWIARRLRAILDSSESMVAETDATKPGQPTLRAAQPRDVAILFRALSSVAEYEKALQKYDIPYYLVGGHAFYAQQEIYDLLNLLRAIASPADALSLAGVLRSPFFSLTDETLFWLAQHPEGIPGGLFAPTPPGPLDANERRKVEFAASTLGELRDKKDCIPVAALINAALDATGYDAALLAEFLGERKLANLRKLIEQARSFDRSGLFTLADFIEQLSSFVVEEPKEPLAATHPEATNVVRLMTIHTSKGLEFPIVVVPDLGRGAGGKHSPMKFTAELGPMVRLPENRREKDAVGGYELHTLLAKEEDEQESRRLLYVAATRAADYLILFSGVEEIGKTESPWLQLLARHFDLASGKVIHPLPSDWRTPEVLVTTVRPETARKPAKALHRADLAKAVAAAEALASDGKGLVPHHAGPVAIDSAARRQFSFSRLTGQLHADQPEEAAVAASDYVLPAAILDPLGLGTLVHAVLAEIDFANKATDVPTIVNRHAERHLDEPHGEIEEASEMIERLLASSAAHSLASAKSTYTELEFLLGWPPGNTTTDNVYLRGFIDRLWQDSAGDWHVLDFKTNRITPDSLASTATKYELQMLVYGLAVEQIFGQPPKSLTLHFLRTGDEQSFPWNLAAKERVVKIVGDAIAGARRA